MQIVVALQRQSNLMIGKKTKQNKKTGEQFSVFAQSSSQLRDSGWGTTNRKAARNGTSVHKSADSLLRACLTNRLLVHATMYVTAALQIRQRKKVRFQEV